jgi:transposase
MAFLSVIRRWHFRDGFSIREIARRTGLSRNTIRKYLRSDTVEPKFKVPERPSKIDPFAEKLSGWLKAESRKPRKQRRTVKQIHADLVSLGFEGSYGRVAVFARRWKEDFQRQQNTTGRGVFVPLAFEPGEAFQFDWSEDWALIGGERVKLQIAHFKLCYSRAFALRAYLLQTHEMLFDAHNHAFRVLGGVPRRGIYDNMRTAVDKVGRGKARQVNARFSAMASHFVFEPEFCNPAAGWEKGLVEKNVLDMRHRLFQPLPRANSLDELNIWLEQRCKALWEEIAHGAEPGSVEGLRAWLRAEGIPKGQDTHKDQEPRQKDRHQRKRCTDQAIGLRAEHGSEIGREGEQRPRNGLGCPITGKEHVLADPARAHRFGLKERKNDVTATENERTRAIEGIENRQPL